MLPSKTFLVTHCELFESNFEQTGTVDPHRIAEFLQDSAGEHADKLGFGWDSLDKTGCLWVLSKLKLHFDVPVTKQTKAFDLYTWPLKPAKYFAERCFVALSEGKPIFQATTVWLVIDRNTRRIVSADKLSEIYNCDFDTAHCDVLPDFERIRRDDGYALCYDKTVRRTDLDVNGHVNNTNYVNYALDALDPCEVAEELEIVYQKELRLYDEVHIYSKRQGNTVYVVGEKEETCFTAKLTLAKEKNGTV